MDDRNVFDFGGPEMSRADRNQFLRARLLSVAGLLFALLVAALVAGLSRPEASRDGVRGADAGQAKAFSSVEEATACPHGEEGRQAVER